MEVDVEFETYQGSGGSFEKLPDYLLFQKTNSTSADTIGLVIGTSNMIDVSPYKVLSYNLDIDKLYFGIGLMSSKLIKSYTDYRTYVVGDMTPTNNYGLQYFDVSNINENVFIALSSLYNPEIVTVKLNELWFE